MWQLEMDTAKPNHVETQFRAMHASPGIFALTKDAPMGRISWSFQHPNRGVATRLLFFEGIPMAAKNYLEWVNLQRKPAGKDCVWLSISAITPKVPAAGSMTLSLNFTFGRKCCIKWRLSGMTDTVAPIGKSRKN